MLNQPRSSSIKRMLLRRKWKKNNSNNYDDNDNGAYSKNIETKTTHFSDWIFFCVLLRASFVFFHFINFVYRIQLSETMMIHIKYTLFISHQTNVFQLKPRSPDNEVFAILYQNGITILCLELNRQRFLNFIVYLTYRVRYLLYLYMRW